MFWLEIVADGQTHGRQIAKKPKVGDVVDVANVGDFALTEVGQPYNRKSNKLKVIKAQGRLCSVAINYMS